MSIRVRRATERDLDFVLWVTLAAWRGHLDRGIWEYLTATDEADTIKFFRYLATTETIHLLHQSLFLIAELDGKPGAAMSAFDSETQGFDVLLSHVPAAAAASGVDLRDPEYARRGGVLLTGMIAEDPGPPEPRWVVENVATRPEMRRRGLVDALLHQLLGQGRERGYAHAQVGVYIGNERARRAYVKAGFEPIAASHSEDWERELGFPGTERLLLPL